ncbi:MAG TPA: YceI family protein [Gemmatales bacterium]|nr:YceI family protein [Gemmatales bacterium]
MTRMLCTLALVTLMSAPAAEATEAKFSLTGNNTKVTFVGTKPNGKHDGGFRNLTGMATVDGSDVTSLKLSVEIDVNSIYSDNNQLTQHLKSGDFFDVRKHPKARFASTRTERSGEGWNITGALTMLAKPRAVPSPATIEASSFGLKLKTEFTINRTQWGMTYGKGRVDEDVKLAVEVTVAK